MENVMITMILYGLAVRLRRRWRRLNRRIAAWWRRARARDELMSLSDRSLQDIGASRGAASFEVSRPSWWP